MHQVQCNNNARYLYLQSQFHWSNARWKKEKRLSHRPILTLSPLHYGDFSDVINLDHCNLFLLGLHYYSTLGVLSDILLLHDLSWTFSALIRDVVTIYFSKQPKKPPDIEEVSTHNTLPDPAHHTVSRTLCVACSTALTNRLDDKGYSESFDSEDTFMVGLDSLCSCHLFPSKSDFVSQILPIDPFGIQGGGGGGYKGNWQRNYSSPVPL
jgi:hypothetical protein